MSDLVSRKDVIDVLKQRFEDDYLDGYKLLKHIKTLPSAEPERIKGEWKKIGNYGKHYRCDQCGNTLDFDGVNAGRGDANFCPNCGADMRGDHE